MGHNGGRRTKMEAVSPLLRCAICTGHPLVLPHMLNPRFHKEGLDVAARIGRITEQAPAHRAVTPPPQPHGIHGHRKLVCSHWIDVVLDHNQHWSIFRPQCACYGWFWPVQRGPEIHVVSY